MLCVVPIHLGHETVCVTGLHSLAAHAVNLVNNCTCIVAGSVSWLLEGNGWQVVELFHQLCVIICYWWHSDCVLLLSTSTIDCDTIACVACDTVCKSSSTVVAGVQTKEVNEQKATVVYSCGMARRCHVTVSYPVILLSCVPSSLKRDL